MRRLIFCLILLSVDIGSGIANPAEKPRHVIYMALYRGVTNAERGFMDYLLDRAIPVDFVIRNADNDLSAIVAMRDEIRIVKPDLVYSFGTTVTRVLVGTTDQTNQQPYIADIPILFNIVADPVGARLVDDSKRSGRNLTGVTHAVPMKAQYQALREALSFQRLGVIYNPDEINSVLSVEELARLANKDNFTVVEAKVRPTDTQDIHAVLRRGVQDLLIEGVQVIYLPSDSFVIAYAQVITDLATAAGIPTFSATEDPIRLGGATMGLTSAYYNVGQFAGFKAEQILVEKRDPAEIPIESLDRFAFVVNVEAMRRTDSYPPVTLLRFAELICHSGCRASAPQGAATATMIGTTTASAPAKLAPEPERLAQETSPLPTAATPKAICDPSLPYTFRHDASGVQLELTRCMIEREGGEPRLLDAPPLTGSLILLIQKNLNDLGFKAGRADGLMGQNTRRAIRRFQSDQGITASGLVDFVLLERIQHAAKATKARMPPADYGKRR